MAKIDKATAKKLAAKSWDGPRGSGEISEDDIKLIDGWVFIQKRDPRAEPMLGGLFVVISNTGESLTLPIGMIGKVAGCKTFAECKALIG